MDAYLPVGWDGMATLLGGMVASGVVAALTCWAVGYAMWLVVDLFRREG